MCSRQSSSITSSAIAIPDGAIAFRVADMTCGHCAGTIRNAIEGRLPGSIVTADPASKLVSVRGSADFAAMKAAVSEAGYTPDADAVR